MTLTSWFVTSVTRSKTFQCKLLTPAETNAGGMAMNAKEYWNMFLLTGAPAFYLQYKESQMEETHVFDDPGHRPESHGLQ